MYVSILRIYPLFLSTPLVFWKEQSFWNTTLSFAPLIQFLVYPCTFHFNNLWIWDFHVVKHTHTHTHAHARTHARTNVRNTLWLFSLYVGMPWLCSCFLCLQFWCFTCVFMYGYTHAEQRTYIHLGGDFSMYIWQTYIFVHGASCNLIKPQGSMHMSLILFRFI